ncbi:MULTISPECIES: hypothetical protein [Streptomyces]|uniref:hypothetical protein n=1 Tax=Streptomyces TaxID=1883 RepID=UPI0016782DC8|nr:MULTISPECIES: hypothetical protein [Streptomyces]MBD3579777.1 hypothetical protein [Streptomyces sp. KD18]GGS95190.1 hypothetical protein GCM10010286_20220 [Streptomyces toxytricini]
MRSFGRAAARATAAAILAAAPATASAACAPAAPQAPAKSAPAGGPSASSPAEICSTLVSYWAKEALTGGKWAGLDWEQKGLSNAQFAIHEDAVAAGRAVERTHGRDKALETVDRVVAERCAAEGGATGSSENWRAPSPAG